MTPAFIHTLLLLSLPTMAGLGWAGLLISNAQQREAQFTARAAAMLARPGGQPIAVPRQIARAAPADRPAPLARVLALVGCDHARREIYPMPWWVVLLIALGAARLVVLLAAGLLGSLSWALWPVAWVMFCRSAFSHWDGKRRDLLLGQFPDALAMIVRCVRVGVPVTEGIRVVAQESPEPTGTEFAHLADDIAIGTPLDAALKASALRTGLPEYRFFATALTLQAQTGGGLSDSLEILADVIRKRVALRARGYALTSEGRTSTIVLCIMPFLIAGMLLVLNPAYFMPMFTEPAGRKMLTVGILMLLTAIFVMRRMIRATLA